MGRGGAVLLRARRTAVAPPDPRVHLPDGTLGDQLPDPLDDHERRLRPADRPARALDVPVRERSLRCLARRGRKRALQGDGLRRADPRAGAAALLGLRRSPAGARDLVLGPWFQPTLETDKYELADRFRAEDVPVTVAQTYTHYLPCGVHRGNERAERERIRAYHQRGYRITTYFNPHICTTYQPLYDEAAAKGLLVENESGEPYVLSNPFTADEMVSEIDFTEPGGVRLFQGLLDDAIDAGYDGWMEDFGEYTPTDSRFGNGRSGRELHNRYPVLYHRASTQHTRRRMGREAAVFVRSGYHGSQRFSRIVWGGDPTEDWSCSDGLCAAVHQALSIGLSGIAYWGSDIGGFHALVNSRTDDELTARWLQFGAVSGIMRTQANGLSFVGSRASRSQVWHEGVLPIWRRYSKLRTQLAPYIEAASDTYQRGGLPITRALALAYPDDARAVRSQTEFLFGPDLLAAPVIEPRARTRSLHLPAGRWIDLWRSVDWRAGVGTISLRRPRVLRGGRRVTLPAPLEELPLLVRAGAVIPLGAPEVDTLTSIGEKASGLVSARERRDRMRLLAFPAGRSSARLPDGERLLSRARPGVWRLQIDVERRRRWSLQASLTQLEGIGRICDVE
ncbi:MAG: glycoside hydrolase family 31 protein, partial [Thermoleophilaceae bacterium]|nr:glycoside hydrolase family 31 protein [Thermoleophilaceae bacterium]